MRKMLLVAAVLVAAVLAQAVDKKLAPVLLKRPNQSVEIHGLRPPAPGQKCENWGWAASLEMMLRMQGVQLDQRYWVTKLNGGEVCVTDLGTLDELAQTVNGEYILGPGRKVRLAAKVQAGAPTVPDDLIVTLRSGQPWLFFWKGHPYLMVGVTYDEFIGQNNARIFFIKEIKLLDPLAENEEQRLVSFVRDRDSTADIGGTMSVQATPVE